MPVFPRKMPLKWRIPWDGKSLRVFTNVFFSSPSSGVNGLHVISHPSLRVAPSPRLPRPSPARDFSQRSGTIPPPSPQLRKNGRNEALTFGFFWIASRAKLFACS